MGTKAFISTTLTSLPLKNWLLGVGLVFSIGQGFAQTFQLPDTNFRNKLMISYPALMSGTSLNIAAATAYPGVLSLGNSNISDLTGIEYFGKMYLLDVSQNQLTTLPGLSGLKQLSALWVSKNKLTALPTLTALSNLIDLTFNDNQVAHFPDVSGLTGLKIIYCARNKLKVLPDLTPFASTLTYLHVSENQLDSLPDLTIFTKLAQLHCDNNLLNEIRGLQKLTSLQVLYCWNNSIKDLSGLSNNTALGIFYCYNNQVSSLPNLNNKPLYKVNISTNRLTFKDLVSIQLPSTISNWVYAPQDSIGILTNQNVNEGQSFQLTTPVDYGILGNKYYWYKNGVLLDSNQSGIFTKSNVAISDSGKYTLQIKNTNLPSLTLFGRPWMVHSYFGYDSVGLRSVLQLREKDALSLVSPVVSTTPGASYTWYKNGTPILINQTGSFSKSSVVLNDSGSYWVEINFPGYPKLRRVSRQWKIKISPCLELYGFKTTITQNDCSEGIGVEFTQISLGGHNFPYSYALVRSDKSDTTWSSSMVFGGNLPGRYQLVVKDAKNCSVSAKVQLPKTEGCENVFSPNGNTNRTSYYIEEPGKAQIVDIKGNIVAELTTPGYWDGMRSDMSLADTGYYAILVNNKKVGMVTLVR